MERLKEILTYNPETGMFCWRVSLSNRRKAGHVAGCICKTYGYRIIGIDGHVYRSSRLAYLYMMDKFPDDLIDHINGIRSDDRWCNLRCATHSQNHMNIPHQRNNTLGLKGVYFHKQSGKYCARITVNRRTTALGLYKTPAEAYTAYCNAATALHGNFANIQ